MSTTSDTRNRKLEETELPATPPAGQEPAAEPESEHTSPARHVLRVPTFGLSATQLVATGLAGTTATFAASYLGVTGTVIGAALASVLTAVGNAVYGQSLRRTREVVLAPVARVVPHTEPRGGAVPELPPELPRTQPRATIVNATRAAWRRAAVGALAVFVVIMAVITGVELVAGRPVSDLVRGDSGKGTSFFGGETVRVRTRTVPPTAPTVTLTVTPKVEFTTPTVTQDAPAVTKTNTPTTTISPSVTPSRASAAATPKSTPTASQSSTP